VVIDLEKLGILKVMLNGEPKQRITIVGMKPLSLHQITGPVSLLLRLPSNGDPIDKIASEHERVIRASRKVWLGVFGTKLSSQTLEVLKSRGEYLYMMQMGKRGAIAYKGVITDVAEFLSGSELRLVPNYYEEKSFTPLAKFWVRLSSLDPVAVDELDELRVARTGTMVLDLFRSMTSVAIVMKDHASESKSHSARVAR